MLCCADRRCHQVVVTVAVSEDERNLARCKEGGSRDDELPLILSTRLVKDIVLSVDGQNTVLHDALPIIS